MASQHEVQGGEEKTVILGGDEEPRSEATTATNGRVTPQTRKNKYCVSNYEYQPKETNIVEASKERSDANL